MHTCGLPNNTLFTACRNNATALLQLEVGFSRFQSLITCLLLIWSGMCVVTGEHMLDTCMRQCPIAVLFWPIPPSILNNGQPWCCHVNALASILGSAGSEYLHHNKMEGGFIMHSWSHLTPENFLETIILKISITIPILVQPWYIRTKSVRQKLKL